MGIDCAWASAMMSNGSAVQCPNNDCGPRFDREHGRYEYFNAFGDRWSGYMPAGAHYEGGGQWYINVGGGDPNSDDPSERPRRWRPERGSGFTQDDLPLFGYKVGGVFLLAIAPLNTAPDEITIQTLKDNCAIGAMLDAIAYAEGNPGYGTVVRGKVTKSPNDPSLVGQRDVTITDFSRHPNITVQLNKKLYSTAAGRYQFKVGTWESLELQDFSPASQDEGARILMGRRGMIEPLLAGDFAKAVEQGNREWASLPGSPYGQPTKTLDELKGVYDQSYNNCLHKLFGSSR
jgi:muramidase (phage lysozyme)